MTAVTARKEVRRRFLELVLAVVVVDAIVIGIWRALDIEHASQRDQFRFGVAWMVVTLVVVGIGLKRFHAARRAAWRERDG